MMSTSNETTQKERNRRMRNTVYEMMQIIINMVEKDSLNVCRIHPSGVLGPQDYAYQWRIG